MYGEETLVALSITFSFISSKYLLILFSLHVIPSDISQFPNFDTISFIESLLLAYIEEDDS